MREIKKSPRVLICFILAVFFLIFVLFFLRNILSRQVDDVNPLIACDPDLIVKSKNLAVIPIYENLSISKNTEWCNYINGLNKTLVMHGVYHYYDEFNGKVDEEQLDYGIGEFEKCFGYKPKIFEAPQLSISRENIRIIERRGIKIRGYWFNIFHKVYHCSDTGKYSNNFIDKF